MIYLLLSILSSTTIAIIFKLVKGFKINIFPIIVINYYSATALGILLNKQELVLSKIIQSDWLIIALVIGFLLIIGFYLIGYTTQKIGIAITTVSNKTSFIIPILFSIIYFTEDITIIKITGIIIAVIAMVLAVYKKRKVDFDIKLIYLPILLFFVIGIIDASIKLAQENFVPENEIPLFSASAFGLAAIIGTIIAFFNKTISKENFNLRTLIVGVFLGLANFGSMYFIIFALNHSGLDSSIVYGVNNIGIISITVVIGATIFKEKLHYINWFGILLSIISVIILTMFL